MNLYGNVKHYERVMKGNMGRHDIHRLNKITPTTLQPIMKPCSHNVLIN